MIFTNLNDKFKNNSLAKKIQQCINYTVDNKLSEFELGSYKIEGTDIKFGINEYNTKSVEESFWETHLQNIDVQIVLKGHENILLNNSKNLLKTSIDVDRDLVMYEGEELFRVPMNEGDMLVLYTEDAHMPGIKIDESTLVKKVVFKINKDTI